MLRAKLVSTCVRQADYDPRKRELTLALGGGTYRYKNVPQVAYDRLVTAESAGREYNRNIRGRYEATRVAPEGGGF